MRHGSGTEMCVEHSGIFVYDKKVKEATIKLISSLGKAILQTVRKGGAKRSNCLVKLP